METRASYTKKKMTLEILTNGNGASKCFLAELERRGFVVSLDSYGDMILTAHTDTELAKQELEVYLNGKT